MSSTLTTFNTIANTSSLMERIIAGIVRPVATTSVGTGATVTGISLNIPFCDMVYMHEWLATIGLRNRMRIRHVELRFYNSRFLKALGELHCDNLYAPFYSGKPSRIGRDMVEKGLKLLSQAHNLDTVEISFKKNGRGKDIYIYTRKTSLEFSSSYLRQSACPMSRTRCQASVVSGAWNVWM